MIWYLISSREKKKISKKNSLYLPKNNSTTASSIKLLLFIHKNLTCFAFNVFSDSQCKSWSSADRDPANDNSKTARTLEMPFNREESFRSKSKFACIPPSRTSESLLRHFLAKSIQNLGVIKYTHQVQPLKILWIPLLTRTKFTSTFNWRSKKIVNPITTEDTWKKNIEKGTLPHQTLRG